MAATSSRRSVVLAALTGAAGTAAAAATIGADRGSPTGVGEVAGPLVRAPFWGRQQAGVEQSPPAHATWTGFDLSPGATRAAVRGLFTLWTDDISRMMDGRPALADLTPQLVDETGTLTVTLGLGPGFFDRLKLARPSWLAPLPAFPIDRLEDRWRQTDLVLQVRCADPVALGHAADVVRRTAQGVATPVWTQRGLRPPPRRGDGGIIRNAFGQLDGIVNPQPRTDDPLVWQQSGSPGWMRGGTSLVLRRIRMDLDAWSGVDETSRAQAIGRHTGSGAPLTGGTMHTAPDLHAKDDLGLDVIDPAAHMRAAMPRAPHERILRQPYNYEQPSGGGVEAGLIFAAYQADPVRQFLPIQRRLAAADLLNVWTTPIGSAVYAIPRGARPGQVLAADVLG